ncbi:cupin domain-containing protein [Mesorhizobium sp. B2-3-11]|uniref:helix-turn-helix domain-containing protein n=1 Tax=Mesorhizobium sp. B2-3-11 TaxID=2589953 RepID=UPI00112A3912|nr:cupin domain-containing protein [Mesorhizobium sp. B2-3-11]TPM05387.1 cupin domain-containing protein [Mesorhizobium sp. B2-3-11]
MKATKTDAEQIAAMTPRSESIAEAVSTSAVSLGERVRSLRTARDLTIAELAQRAGLSSGIISQIERGRSNPSIRTLQLLRAALGMNLWEFLEPPGRAVTVSGAEREIPDFICRKSQRQTLVVGKTKLVKELLSPRNDQNLRFMIVTLPPGSESEDVLQSPGQKGGYMLSGRARLQVGDRSGDLEEGDSFQFPADISHKIDNPYEEPAQLMWIMSILDAHL